MASGSWALAEELFARGDSAFIAELRCIHDADRLGTFAARWLGDTRPEARRLLIEYLSLPFNAYRHEALVKRLFKGAEKAGDDELMGVFLVAFDRTIRRNRKTRRRHKWGQFTTREEAETKARAWDSEGYQTNISAYGMNRFYAFGTKQEEAIVGQNNAMPRPKKGDWGRSHLRYEISRQRLEKRFILFSTPTRRYLRRRAWRYFRKLGKTNPERYRAAALAYLKLYTDSDVDSDIHLLDNWGLIHTLFFDCPALVRPARGWELAEGKTLADLTPAPRFPAVWLASPQSIWDLLMDGNCRTVRQWAARMLRSHHSQWLSKLSVAALLATIDHADTDVQALGFELLEKHTDLATVPVDAWLTRLDGDDLDRLQRLSALLARQLDPARVSLADTVKLALHRSLPIAKLGLTLLQGRAEFGQNDIGLLLQLTQAECESLRAEIAQWLRDRLKSLGPAQADWVMEFLDSKYAYVRAVGWMWLRETPLRNDPAIWHKLLESPYDDIKGFVIADLTEHCRGADLDTVNLLWASVLLNLHGGGRHKPGVVSQIVERLTEHPDEREKLLPLLAIAVRSLRGPEFRAGLTGVVGLFERNAELRPAIAKQFPELVVS